MASTECHPRRGGSTGIRILVVDDNPTARSYLRALLEQQLSWQVCEEARTGEEALQRLRQAAPDLVMLDFQMPDLNGLEVARQISLVHPNVPVLMVTIHLSKQLAQEALKAGIKGVCAKSDLGSIVDAVNALLHEGTYFPIMNSTG
jgi:DNA-binding NarL/FixJ family response regulator